MSQKKDPEEVRWADSDARKMLVADLESGVLPAFSNEMGPKDACQAIYSHCPEFKGMDYNKFRDRLNCLRKAHRLWAEMAMRDADALAHDRRLHPQKKTNQHGMPVFDLSSAKPLLRLDISQKKHEKMSLQGLHNSRPEYSEFTRQTFKERVYQEVGLQKFIAHLEAKHNGDGNGDGSMDDLEKAMKGLSAAPSSQEKRQDKMEAWAKSKETKQHRGGS